MIPSSRSLALGMLLLPKAMVLFQPRGTGTDFAQERAGLRGGSGEGTEVVLDRLRSSQLELAAGSKQAIRAPSQSEAFGVDSG